MQSLPTLIRLARRATDERKTDLGRIGQAQAALEASIERHDQSMALEDEAASADFAALAAYAGWNSLAGRERARLLAQRRDLERQEAAARDILRTAFVEQKRLEVAQDARQQAERADAARRAERQHEDQQTIALHATRV